MAMSSAGGTRILAQHARRPNQPVSIRLSVSGAVEDWLDRALRVACELAFAIGTRARTAKRRPRNEFAVSALSSFSTWLACRRRLADIDARGQRCASSTMKRL
jgi:hypothetical protein